MKKIIILGGGAIGAATSFFLAKRGATPIVVERHEVGGAASGKSGGFLAYDWCRGTALDRLARRSFDLHAELAEELGNPWLYQRLKTFAGHASGKVTATISGQIGTPETTAIVEPRAFTQGLVKAAQERGGQLVKGAAADLLRSGDGVTGGAVTGVRLESGETIEGDAVVIALGPWSLLASRWLPLPAVHGVKGHSLVFDAGKGALDEALFLEVEDGVTDGPGDAVLTPEIFPRADGTVWACAISSQPGLPVDPARVAPDAGAHARLEALCRAVVPALAKAPIVAKQACFRPLTEDGLPLIGAVQDAPGAYVATGHSVWGMLNSPATGEAMAELLLDGVAKTVDLRRFDPGRLEPLDPKLLGSG